MNPAGLPIPVPAAVAAVAAMNGMREAALGSAGPSSSQSSLLGRLKPGEAVDVWDIHELGWRKALVIASRTVQITNNGNNKLEFLIRYVGWDSKCKRLDQTQAIIGICSIISSLLSSVSVHCHLVLFWG